MTKTILSVIIMCVLSVGPSLVGCGEKNDGTDYQFEFLKRQVDCNSYINQYYEASMNMNRAVGTCAFIGEMDPDYAWLCHAMAGFPHYILMGEAYDAIGSVCSCSRFWPDNDAIDDQCQEVCSEEPYPCKFLCNDDLINELNDSFWECFDGEGCMESCERDSSSCKSGCNVRDPFYPFCKLDCQLSDIMCHLGCLG